MQMLRLDTQFLFDFYRFSVFILSKNKICLFIINKKKLLFNLKKNKMHLIYFKQTFNVIFFFL